MAAVPAVPTFEKPSARPLPAYLAPVSPFIGLYNGFASWRSSLGLPNPGTAENLQKEVKGTCAGIIRVFRKSC
jgi:mitochondrial import receptor subunit TOM40